MNNQQQTQLESDNSQQQQIKQNQIQNQQLQNPFKEHNMQNQSEDPQQKLQDIHKEYRKNQAFSNFIKCNSPLFSQAEKGVTVKMINNNFQEQDKDYKINSVKSVQFNLQNNFIHPIVKHPSEYLTLNEKFNLQRSIQQYAMQNRFDSTSEEDDEDIEDQLSFIEVIVKEFTQQPKSILKKQPKEFKHEADDDEDYYQNKGLSYKEIRNLEKKVKEHDYGVGLELLQKLGFKYGEGLGINRQGILEPVIPIKKQVFTGNQSNQNKVNEEEQVWQYEYPQETKTLKKQDKIWRKKNQMDYAVDIQQFRQINTQNVNIQEYLIEVQELTQSVQHLLLTKFSKYQTNQQTIQQHKNKIVSLQTEQEKALNYLEIQQENIKKQQSFQKYLLFFKDDEVQISNEPFPLFEKFLECFIKHPELFIQFNLIDLLTQQGADEIKQMTKDWQGPQENILKNEFHLISKIVNLAKEVFIHQNQLNLDSNYQDSQILVIDNVISINDYLNLQRIVEKLINPIFLKLEDYLTSQYDPLKPNLLLEMFKLWTNNISQIEIDEIQDQQLKLFDQKTIQKIFNLLNPKLKKYISNWNINESIQLHQIILPWIDSQFNNKELLDHLIQKLLDIHLEDQSDFGLTILLPWAQLQQWNQILQILVIPKMLIFIQNLDVVSDFQAIQKILVHIDSIQEYAQILFEPLINKLNDYACQTIEKNLACQDQEFKKEISLWLNEWEQVLQDKVISKTNCLSEKFNLIKEKLI